MTGEEFSKRFQLQDRLTSAGVSTFRGIDVGRGPVLVHLLPGEEISTPGALERSGHELAGFDKLVHYETLEVEGQRVVVTAPIDGFTTYEAWISDVSRRCSAREAPTKEAAPIRGTPQQRIPRPSDAHVLEGPEEYTRVLRIPSFGPGVEREDSPEEDPQEGEPYVEPGEPTSPGANPATGTYTRIMRSAEHEPPPGMEGKTAPRRNVDAETDGTGEYTRIMRGGGGGDYGGDPPEPPRPLDAGADRGDGRTADLDEPGGLPDSYLDRLRELEEDAQAAGSPPLPSAPFLPGPPERTSTPMRPPPGGPSEYTRVIQGGGLSDSPTRPRPTPPPPPPPPPDQPPASEGSSKTRLVVALVAVVLLLLVFLGIALTLGSGGPTG